MTFVNRLRPDGARTAGKINLLDAGIATTWEINTTQGSGRLTGVAKANFGDAGNLADSPGKLTEAPGRQFVTKFLPRTPRIGDECG